MCECTEILAFLLWEMTFNTLVIDLLYRVFHVCKLCMCNNPDSDKLNYLCGCNCVSYLSTCVSVYAFVYVSMHACVCVCVCMCVCLYVYGCYPCTLVRVCVCAACVITIYTLYIYNIASFPSTIPI